LAAGALVWQGRTRRLYRFSGQCLRFFLRDCHQEFSPPLQAYLYRSRLDFTVAFTLTHV